MTKPDEQDDAARDPHLLAALRHAPDRDAKPPPEVTARILAAARAAVRPAAAPSWTERLAAWWQRPQQLGAAFGTLMVALLVGMLWSTREPPPASAPFEAAPSSAPVLPAPVAERDAVGASNDEQAMADAARHAAPPAGPAPKAEAPRRAPATPRPEAKAEAGADKREATQPRAAAVEAPPPPPAPAAAPAEPLREAAAQEGAVTQQRNRASDLLASGRLERRDASNAASMPQASAVAGLTAKAGSAPSDPLARIDAALAAGATWQSAGVPGERAHGPAQRAWWASVRAATQGRWEAVAPIAPAAWLSLGRGPDGAVLWTMDAALYISIQGRTWRAPIDAARLADWQAEVARW